MADPGDHLGGTPEGSDTTVPLFRYCKVTKTYVRRPGYIQASSAAEAEELKRNMARAMLTHTTFDHTQQPHFTKDKRSSSGSIFIKNTKRARTTPAPRAAPQIPPELLPYLLDESEHVRADIGSSTPSGTTRGFSDGGEAFTGKIQCMPHILSSSKTYEHKYILKHKAPSSAFMYSVTQSLHLYHNMLLYRCM